MGCFSPTNVDRRDPPRHNGHTDPARYQPAPSPLPPHHIRQPPRTTHCKLKSRLNIDDVKLPVKDADIVQGSTHFNHLRTETSEKLRVMWSQPHEYSLPAYDNAFNTKLERFLRNLSDELKHDSALKIMCEKEVHFNEVLLHLISKAYPGTQAASQSDIIHGCNIFQTVRNLFTSIGWRQPYMTLALKRLLAFEHGDVIVAKLSEICDRANRCSSAKRQAINS